MQDHLVKITVSGNSTYNDQNTCDNSQSTREIPVGSSLQSLLPPPNCEQPTIVAALVNNQLKDLNYKIFCQSEIQWLDYTHDIGNRIYKESLSFLLFVVCQELYPNYMLKVEHSLRNGRFCRLLPKDDLPLLKADDYAKIEHQMSVLVKAKLPISKTYLAKNDAIAFFTANNFQVMAETLAIIKAKQIPIYSLENHSQYLFSKLVPNTSFLANFSLHAFQDGFIIMEPRSFNMAVCANPTASNLEYAFPHQMQASLRSYSDWTVLQGVEYAANLNKAIEYGSFFYLIIMAESLQLRRMQEIADQVYVDFPQVKIVLVAGPSSSGKTTFTKLLALEFRALGLTPIVLSMDNYFVDRAKTPLGDDGKPDFEGLSALDLPYFNQQLLEMISGKKVEIPVYDFKKGVRSDKTKPVQLSDKHILLIEGIHGLNERLTASIPAANKRKVFISCLTQLNLDRLSSISSSDNREIRRLVRDLKFRGTPCESTLLNWASVRRGEEKNIFPFQEGADFYFNSSLIYEWPILRPLVEEHLKKVPDTSPAFSEAQRLLKLISCFLPFSPKNVPVHSLLQEFLGNSCFEQ